MLEPRLALTALVLVWGLALVALVWVWAGLGGPGPGLALAALIWDWP